MALVTTTAVVGAASVANSAYQGKKSREAAEDAANLQAQAAADASQLTINAQEQLRQDLSPYRQAGETAIPLLEQLATDPSKAVDDLQSNALFQASLASRDRDSLGAAATQGRIGTGDLSQQLSENFLLTASPLIQQQEQSLLNLANLGQASSAQVGASGLQAAGTVGSTLQSAADAQSAGIVADQQATANQNAQILNQLPTLISSFQSASGSGSQPIITQFPEGGVTGVA